MASTPGINQRGETDLQIQVAERIAKMQSDKAGPEPTLWESQMIAWEGLLRAIKKDNEEKTLAAEKGIPYENNLFAKQWFRENWKFAVVWGLLIIIVIKILSTGIKPMKRVSQRSGRSHHGINKWGEAY